MCFNYQIYLLLKKNYVNYILYLALQITYFVSVLDKYILQHLKLCLNQSYQSYKYKLNVRIC
jgi:hypothetical protein